MLSTVAISQKCWARTFGDPDNSNIDKMGYWPIDTPIPRKFGRS